MDWKIEKARNIRGAGDLIKVDPISHLRNSKVQHPSNRRNVKYARGVALKESTRMRGRKPQR
jgi:hypothetical protein